LTDEYVTERWVESWDSLISLERRRLTCVALFALLGAGFTAAAARVVVMVRYDAHVK